MSLHINYNRPYNFLPIFCSSSSFSFLRYRLLDEKDLIKHKAIVINKPMLYAICAFLVLTGALKVVLVGAGMSVVQAYRVYNPLLCLILTCVCISMIFCGIKLRHKLKKLVQKSGSTFKLTLMMLLGNLGMIGTIVSLVIWCAVPDIFGMSPFTCMCTHMGRTTCFLAFTSNFCEGLRV